MSHFHDQNLILDALMKLRRAKKLETLHLMVRAKLDKAGWEDVSTLDPVGESSFFAYNDEKEMAALMVAMKHRSEEIISGTLRNVN